MNPPNLQDCDTGSTFPNFKNTCMYDDEAGPLHGRVNK